MGIGLFIGMMVVIEGAVPPFGFVVTGAIGLIILLGWRKVKGWQA
jgi:hypothetical protein